MHESHIYDSGTNQYRTVTDLSIVAPHTSLEGTHKFFPGNNGDKFMVDGFVFVFPEQVRIQKPESQERIVFMKRDGDVPKLVAAGIANRVEDIFAMN
ncbi:hypothetical protein K2X92_03180 [Candidatus Gracilibacteria bacterium]|nr:hypothetical protein [Candidatus Gracilibacteria bacterium]